MPYSIQFSARMPPPTLLLLPLFSLAFIRIHQHLNSFVVRYEIKFTKKIRPTDIQHISTKFQFSFLELQTFSQNLPKISKLVSYHPQNKKTLHSYLMKQNYSNLDFFSQWGKNNLNVLRNFKRLKNVVQHFEKSKLVAQHFKKSKNVVQHFKKSKNVVQHFKKKKIGTTFLKKNSTTFYTLLTSGFEWPFDQA